MMDFDPEHIHNLTMYEIAGLLTPEEKDSLYEAIAKYQEAFNIWQELHASIGTKEVDEAWESVRLSDPQEIIRSAKKRERRASFINGLKVAAVIIIFVGSYFFPEPARKQPARGKLMSMATTASLKLPPVQLQLANGKIMDLSDTKDASTVVNNLEYNNLPGQNTLSVPIGKKYTVILSDGSEIHLNSASKIIFPFRFTGKTREIQIHGEAYIKAVHNSRQPLLVHLRNSVVTVLGTEFNVNTYDSGFVKVALTRGKIRMRTGNDSVLIKPGNEAIINDGKPMRTITFDEDTLLSWRQGIYDLQKTPLVKICALLQRNYGVRAVVDNKEMENLTFTTRMEIGKDLNESIAAYLNSLKNTFHLNFYYDENGVLHFK